MNILFYNWTQFDKKNNSGGGVNIYQQNLIKYFVENDDTNQFFFISSGTYYNWFNRKTYIKECSNIYDKKCKTYKIYNSPCIAPAKGMYDDIEQYTNDEITYEIFKDFIKKNRIDIIHFNNIEGISTKCLSIKKDFPDLKVVFSVHNYFVFCPQVNLFYNNESNCIDYNNGIKCVSCIQGKSKKRVYIWFYRIDNLLEKIKMERFSQKIKLFFKKILIRIKKKSANKTENEKSDCQKYKKFRKINIQRINDSVDVILAVSDRVKKICVDMGIDKQKVYTNYIGTEVANNIKKFDKEKLKNENLTITYLGYFEKAKGLDFLLDAFSKIDSNLGKKIKFLCYARTKSTEDEIKVKELMRLKEKLAEVEYHNGYSHSDFDKIMARTDLGVIPVIWEDNLPQVAVEFIANGVPILCSDLGGAQELVTDKNFVFRSGDTDSFLNKVESIIVNKNKLLEFFNERVKLTTMEMHIDKLKKIYGI